MISVFNAVKRSPDGPDGGSPTEKQGQSVADALKDRQRTTNDASFAHPVRLSTERVDSILKDHMDDTNYQKLMILKNQWVNEFVAKAADAMQPSEVIIFTGTKAEIAEMIAESIRLGQERKVVGTNWYAHNDYKGPKYDDTGRAVAFTKMAAHEGSPLLNSGLHKDLLDNLVPANEGYEKIDSMLPGMMKGRKMYVFFHTLFPRNSSFTFPCVQITDSPFVGHSEYLMYSYTDPLRGYVAFMGLEDKSRFFRFVHSTGPLFLNDAGMAVPANIADRYIMIDADQPRMQDMLAFSLNTTYPGSSMGYKKIFFRMWIKYSVLRGELAEHMLLRAIVTPYGKVYLAHAGPSGGGKTATAFAPCEGDPIGDDLTGIKAINGIPRGANPEDGGIFAVLTGVNKHSDPVLHSVLRNPKNELIISNALLHTHPDGKEDVWWLENGEPEPLSGINACGNWHLNMLGPDGLPVSPASWNARGTIPNVHLTYDEGISSPDGVPIGIMSYGGRDYNTLVPVMEALDYGEGMVRFNFCLETNKTKAIVDNVTGLVHDPGALAEFLPVPLEQYMQNELDFGGKLDKKPIICGLNYFICDEKGKFLTEKDYKAVWLMWMALRTQGKIGALKTPIGYIPQYQDLQTLFKQVLGIEYTHEEYTETFSLRLRWPPRKGPNTKPLEQMLENEMAVCLGKITDIQAMVDIAGTNSIGAKELRELREAEQRAFSHLEESFGIIKKAMRLDSEESPRMLEPLEEKDSAALYAPITLFRQAMKDHAENHSLSEALKLHEAVVVKIGEVHTAMKQIYNGGYFAKGYIAKNQRMIELFETRYPDSPRKVFEVLYKDREIFRELQAKHGDIVPPSAFEYIPPQS